MNEVSCLEGEWADPVSRRRLRYRCWRPAATRALLIVIHGFGEHGGRYRAVAQALADEGLYVAVPDLAGHGRSDGKRGDMGGPADCARQLAQMADDLFLPASGQTKYAVFGHSFGGLVGILWALRRAATLHRVAIQSPLLEVGFPVPRWRIASALLLARCRPSWLLSMSLEAEALSHDPAVVQAYRDDALVHDAMSARAYRALLQGRDEAFAQAPSLRVPVLLLCGSEDRIISVPAAQRWFDRLTCEKRQRLFPGCYHELHHEPVRDELLRLVRDWAIDAR